MHLDVVLQQVTDSAVGDRQSWDYLSLNSVLQLCIKDLLCARLPAGDGARKRVQNEQDAMSWLERRPRPSAHAARQDTCLSDLAAGEGGSTQGELPSKFLTLFEKFP